MLRILAAIMHLAIFKCKQLAQAFDPEPSHPQAERDDLVAAFGLEAQRRQRVLHLPQRPELEAGASFGAGGLLDGHGVGRLQEGRVP